MTLSLGQLRQGFYEAGYICGESVLLTVYLSLTLGKPLLIEGAPGVGKTELGKVLARALVALNRRYLDGTTVEQTLNLLLKTHQDQLLFCRQIGPTGIDQALRGIPAGGEQGDCS